MATREGGRELPGRLSFALEAPRVGSVAAAAEAAIAALAVLVTRLPLRTHYLLNWDADQFALGMRDFDLVHHQPHPPGYLGYVALGRLFAGVSGDPNAALVALSVLAEMAGVALALLLARRLFGPGAGRVTALALLVSPLYWYYGEAATTYALEPLLTLAVAGFAWRAWNGERRVAVPLALTLAAAGAIRPSTEFLLAPLAAFAVLRLRRPWTLLAAAGTAAAGTLAWALPLLALSGGPAAYWHAATALGSDVTTATAVWDAGLGGLATTTDAVFRGTVWDLGGFAVVAAFGLAVAPRVARGSLSLPRGWGWFAAAWSLPALLTFLLVHIGQVAYVQVFTPVLFLSLGPAVVATARSLGGRRLAPALSTALALASAAASLALFALPPQGSLAGQLRRHDTWVQAMTATVRGFDPGHTVLVADAYGVGSYRTAQVYLPAYHRIGVARDRAGYAGEIFGDVYTPEHFDRATPLVVPPGTDTYVFLDRSTVEQLVADPERMRVIRLAGGFRLYVWTGPPPALHDGLLWLGPPPVERRGLEP